MKLRRTTCLTLAAVILLAAGCSNDDNNSDNSTPTTTSAVSSVPSTPDSTPVDSTPVESTPVESTPGSISVESTGVSSTDSVEGVGGLARYVPPTVKWVAATNWTELQRAAGVTLTSASAESERVQFLTRTARDLAIGSAFAVIDSRSFLDAWGFDATDLSNAATVNTNGPAVEVVTFGAHVDLAKLAERFSEYGFTSTTRDGFTVYSHALAPGATWSTGSSGLAMTNAAVDAERRTMVASSSPDAVAEVLDAAIADKPAEDVVSLLDKTSSAFAGLVMPNACDQLRVEDLLAGSRASEAVSEQIRERLNVDALKPYQSLALGVTSDGSTTKGHIILLYGSPEAAQDDLDARVAAARDGVSMMSGQPLADAVFTVDGARVEGAAVVIEATPVNNLASKFMQMWTTQDLPFAACP